MLRKLSLVAATLVLSSLLLPAASAYDEADRCGARNTSTGCDGPDPDVAGGLSEVTPGWPTLSKGSRGVNVTALQWLLSARYHLTVDKDGKFDAATKAAVQDAQGSAGLTADGVVGPNTWQALTVTLTPGDYGLDVRALRVLMQAKWYEDVELDDGDFTSTLGTRVKNFKEHVGLPSNTTVGEDGWKYLLWHYVKARPSDAPGLCDGGWDQPWGTSYAVDLLRRTANSVDDRYAGSNRVAMNDLSRAHGGNTLFHATHETGKNIDVRPMAKDGEQCGETNRFIYGTSRYNLNAIYSRPKTIALVEEFIENSKNFNTSRRVVEIYFADIGVRDAIDDLYPNDQGIVDIHSDHNDHLHVIVN
ncbi:MAG: peptidoglycan-binding domain-containing protein [Nocardioides sp.]